MPFKLTLVRSQDGQIKFIEEVHGENLVELLAHFMMLIVRVQNQIHEENVRIIKRVNYANDDIPF
jgi:hypothetical protein